MTEPDSNQSLAQALKQALNQALNTLGNMRYTHDFRTARRLTKRYKRELKLPRVDFDVRANTVRSKLTNVSLGLETHPQFVPALGCIEELVSRAGARIDASIPGKLAVEIDNIKYIIETAQEILVLREIFLHGTYNFNLPATAKPIIVFDIGMNVGMASLLFAARPEVERIYSYEPFRETFEQALRNIALNPELANKIVPHNFGLAEKDAELEVEYSTECNANNSIFGLSGEIRREVQTTLKHQTISLRGASRALGEIMSREKDKTIVLKIDCEGAEYQILEALETAGLLMQIHALMIEWHVQGPSALSDRLTKAGYTVFSLDPLSAISGMLYAARS